MGAWLGVVAEFGGQFAGDGQGAAAGLVQVAAEPALGGGDVDRRDDGAAEVADGGRDADESRFELLIDGGDLEARTRMLLASHMAGIGMGTTGLGICHGIGHPLGGRFDIAHGVALTMLLPHVLRFNLPVRLDRTAQAAFALGVGDTGKSTEWNADAAIDAVHRLAAEVGLTGRLGDHGVSEDDFDQLAEDALDDEVMANTPRRPTADQIRTILAAAS